MEKIAHADISLKILTLDLALQVPGCVSDCLFLRALMLATQSLETF